MRSGAIAFAAVLIMAGCGKKDDDKKLGNSGVAKLQLANATGTNLTESYNSFTPTIYGMKLVSVSLMAKLDSEDGSNFGAIIWAAPGCPTQKFTSPAGSTGTGEPDETQYEYYGMEGCPDNAVKDYFDFARSSAAVNAELNSQGLQVLPHTYKYVKLEFCSGPTPNQSEPLTFKTADMNEAFFGTPGSICAGALSEKANPPIVIAPGESVTVSLDYDLNGVIVDTNNPPDYSDGVTCWENEAKTVKRCAKIPAFKPSFTKG